MSSDAGLVGIRGNWRLELGRGRLGVSVGVVGIDVLALAEGVVHGVFGHLDDGCTESTRDGVAQRWTICCVGREVKV